MKYYVYLNNSRFPQKVSILFENLEAAINECIELARVFWLNFKHDKNPDIFEVYEENAKPGIDKPVYRAWKVNDEYIIKEEKEFIAKANEDKLNKLYERRGEENEEENGEDMF